MVKKQNLVRCNTRIRVDQDKFLKSFSKRKGHTMTEGEIVRLALDNLMKYAARYKQGLE